MKTRRSAKTKTRKSTTPSTPRAGKKKPNQDDSFPVVGIGASAGGLDSFERLLRTLPANTGMAFVLVQHLDPTHESRLTEILSRSTKMTVAEAREGMRVEANRVYVIPPNMNMLISDRVLHLEPRQTSEARYMPVDLFFSSLAVAQKNKAIGVILSGTASDGTAGMKAIKVEGGITFAQDSASAKYFGMPQSAIAAGAVDFVLPPEEIARHLARLKNHPYVRSTHARGAEPGFGTKTESSIQQLFRLLKKSFGVDFSGYKFSTINRRINRRMALQATESLEDYLRTVRKKPDELRALFQDMFIGVTEFFRDPGMFKALAKTVYPAILKKRPADLPIRIWVPGCSTGEEVYSIAISLLEFLGRRAPSVSIQIFGTDVNEEAIQKARAGRYGKDIAARMSRARLNRFFAHTDSSFQISKVVRDLCVFAKHDIIQDPPFTHLDLLSCRNLLIYLSSDSQRKLMPLFHYALKPDGFLVLGSAEIVSGFEELFSLRDRKHKFYARRAVGRSSHFELPAGRHLDAWPAKPAGEIPVLRSDFDLQKDLADNLILNQYGPPAVLVNEAWEILHFRGHTGRYLEPAPGIASVNLLKMAREGLLQGLRAALDAARKKGVAASQHGLRVEVGGRERVVDIQVVPIKIPGSKKRAFLVLFDDVTPNIQSVARTVAPRKRAAQGAGADIRIVKLKQELAATKAYLQSSIEGQEANNEELRSLNEEMMSANEELRSTTEELETSNEELQSANEVLTTLNEELQNRNREINQANNDILNLLGSMNLTMLLLDRDLRIRRFTPTAQSVLNLLPSDLGRSLAEVSFPIVIPDLKRHILETMDTLTPMITDVDGLNGHRYELQIHPYVTAEKRIEGAVIGLVDISEMTERIAELAAARASLQSEHVRRTGAQEVARAGEERFRTIADSMPELVSFVDAEQRYQFNNKSYEKWYGIPTENYKGRPVREVLGESLYATVQPYIENALAGQATSYEGYMMHEQIGRRFVHVDYIPRKDEDGKVDGFYVLVRDLTELKDSEGQFRAFVENAPQTILIHDANGKIAVVNSQAVSMFGYSRQELIGQPVEMLMPARFRNSHVGHRKAYMRNPAVRPMGIGLELSALRKDGSEFPVEISLSPVETAKGVLVSSTIVDITERKKLAERTRWATVLEERARMARDIHDTLAQGFTGIILNLEAIEEASAGLPEEIRRRIARARDVARSSLEEARRSVLALASPLPMNGDLAGSIHELVDRLRLATKIRMEFSTRGTAVHLVPPVGENLLRIAQQAVDNSLQHAHATSIGIDLIFGEKEVRLRIKDDGRGFNMKKAHGGMGLIGMRERASMIGGKFKLHSRSGQGTRIEVTVPISRA